ncbi:hypothetical protein DID88_010096 [Monilinia fructigena]|uniref:Peptidase M20 dimerisation domain-containing protein n=1 Tax=Monilinia fructigena TaxID=38457 RepID=A0A395IL50_9HELO|nr:hypothetical protein DID88_010096 [Monilinia fructigena]
MPFSAGTVGTRNGNFGPGLDTYRVTVYGKGGHASQPHMTTDPMVMAASIIVRLQRITSKKLDFHDSAVVTVDSVVAGAMEDIIADQAVLKLNIRYFDSSARKDAVNLMKMILKEVQQGWNASKEPLVELIRSLPLLVNDSAVTQRISASFDATFEERHVKFCAPWGGTEDFNILATEAPNKKGGKGVLHFFWLLGGADPHFVKKGPGRGQMVDIRLITTHGFRR